jgi:hypothetical protein
VRVNHGLDVRPKLVDEKVHRNLAGRLPFPAELVPLHVDDDHVVRPGEPFVAPGRSAHDRAVVQPDTDVAVLCCDKLLLVDEMAETLNFARGIH